MRNRFPVAVGWSYCTFVQTFLDTGYSTVDACVMLPAAPDPTAQHWLPRGVAPHAQLLVSTGTDALVLDLGWGPFGYPGGCSFAEIVCSHLRSKHPNFQNRPGAALRQAPFLSVVATSRS